MNTFVNYHNPKVMGYEPDDVDDLACLTNHSGRSLPQRGDLVYLIGRRFDDPAYRLYGAFEVEDHAPASHPFFKIKVWGKRGRLYRKSWILDDLKWFAKLKHEQGNFGFGLNAVGHPQSAHELHSLIAPGRFQTFQPTIVEKPKPPKSYAKASESAWKAYQARGAVFVDTRKHKYGFIQHWAFPKEKRVEPLLIAATPNQRLKPNVRAGLRRFAATDGRRSLAMTRALGAPVIKWLPSPLPAKG